MNARQMAQQIKHELELAVWPESPSAVVFGTRLVFLVAGLPEEDELPGAFPFALVNIGSGTADPDDPNLLEQTFDVLTVADVSGGRLGEAALIGGAKSALGSSANRGVLELNDRVRSAVSDLTGSDGAKLFLHSASTGSPVRLGRGRHLAIGETSFLGWVTAAPSYAHPTKLARSGSTWTWAGGDSGVRGHCSGRFDFIQYRLGYVAGSTPAESPGDLDVIVYTGTDASTSHAAVADKSYSIFADYGVRGGTQIQGSSDGREIGVFLAT